MFNSFAYDAYISKYFVKGNLSLHFSYNHDLISNKSEVSKFTLRNVLSIMHWFAKYFTAYHEMLSVYFELKVSPIVFSICIGLMSTY